MSPKLLQPRLQALLARVVVDDELVDHLPLHVDVQPRRVAFCRQRLPLTDDVYRELIEQLDFDEASIEARLQSRLQ